jgi:hypothetical protein
MYRPWFGEALPSKSVYEKSPASATVRSGNTISIGAE